MFEHLKKYPRIIVTGPQRAGTTICAKMIAHDTGYRFIDETDYGVQNLNTWRSAIQQNHIVVQCPAMCKEASKLNENYLVVMMKRRLSDIQRSRKRIGWGGNMVELKKYGKDSGDSAVEKYRYWKDHKPVNWIEVRFSSLKNHPLYIPKEQRKHFGPKQTVV